VDSYSIVLKFKLFESQNEMVTIMTTRIIGTGSYVPDHVVTNDDLAGIVDTSDEWIRSRSGISQRRISEGIGTSQMAAEASKRALENAGIAAEEIDLILLATSSPDQCFPNGACEVQAKIGAVNAAAFDISSACTGFEFALNTVYGFLKAGLYRTALVIGADCLSKLVDWSDRSTCVLFGDGAGAAVVRAEQTAVEEAGAQESGILHILMGSDGSKGSVLSCMSRTVGNFLTGTKPELGYMSMDGQEVFKFAVKKVPEMVGKLLEESRVELEDVRYLVIHQANYRICEAVAKRLHISMEKVPTNIDRFGNTSGASVPLLLDELNRTGKLKKGDLLVLAGFGAGLTWGATLVRW
jgi:3-oxoacyl-[acyl-carrier-protein] synthase-3